MKFCSACSAQLDRRRPDGDDRERAMCASCGAIHYENPRTVVGCVVEEQGKILLCRRAIEPALGRWTLPAGFLELDESLIEGAARETREEAEAAVRVTAPLATLDLVHIGQVYSLFRAHLERPGFSAGPESQEVALFGRDELPWDELSFPVMHFALRMYLADKELGRDRVHHGVVRWNGVGSRFDVANYALDTSFSLPLGSLPEDGGA